ncbi:hypothetical protein B484DRAFT_389230, partial [Ochromonadaceae sp. CCMP2298]
MQLQGLEPDVITYTSLIKACAFVGSIDSTHIAEEIFSAMQQRTNHFSSFVGPNQ